MIKELIPDTVDGDRAVSPVIGVILMVAITVILATVIGAVVLDFGNSAGDSAPSASLSVDADTADDQINIEHTGGDTLDSSQTRTIVEVGGSSETFPTESTNQTTLSVGSTAVIELQSDGGGSPPALTENFDFDGDGTVDVDPNNGDDIGALNPGDQITITIIDTESQRQIYKTTVTA